MHRNSGTFIMMPENESAAIECLAACIAVSLEVAARVAVLRNSIESSLDVVRFLVADGTFLPIEEIDVTGEEEALYEAEALYLEIRTSMLIAEDNKKLIQNDIKI